ncbi:LON peptidase substrate-binding domain-containing protein [Agaribacter flavus]|uniref:LON peptidase substrate-binding domain-containing protein n=1 Tax=Agaribacter flavus TaxID=1902781 RepID=A0ABV7FTA4_9ALTE
MAIMKIPLFPLSSHLMPQGRMALRIFEPRYIRMVKQVCEANSGFVICMINTNGESSTNTHIHPIGTFCKVIDFDILDDGLLGVTVQGEYCVLVKHIHTEFDGLRVGECEPNDVWKKHLPSSGLAGVDEKLEEVFSHYPEVSSLYDELKFDDPEWVINRWLELLPVAAEQKQYFLKTGDTQKVLHYLFQLME